MKKLLFFTYDFPYPTNTGGKNRAYNMLKFGGGDTELHLFSFVRQGFKEEFKKEIEKLGVKSIQTFGRKPLKSIGNIVAAINPFFSIFKSLYFEQNIFQELVKTVKEKEIDTVHYESLYTAYYLSDSIEKMGVKQIFGTENIEHVLYQDYAKYLAKIYLKPFYTTQAWKVKKEEEMLFKIADVCLAVTNEEASYIKGVSDKDCFVVENGVDADFYEFKLKKRGEQIRLLFVGNFSYFPNIDAVNFLYKEVFQNLDNINLKLVVVGKNVSNISILKDPRVEVEEFVGDIRKMYYNADMLVFPVRIGGGTNFKVLEAMACGVPIVALPQRVQALGVEENKHMLFAQNQESFIKQIKLLMEKPELGESLSKNARQFVESKFAWQRIGKKLNKIWREI